MIPAHTVERVVESWLATFESREIGFAYLEASTGTPADTWRVRCSDLMQPASKRTGIAYPRGWWAMEKLDPARVDEILVAMDATHLWHEKPLERYSPRRRALRCHDCGKELENGDYRPLELFRPVPNASARIWDSTKQRWMPYRRKRGRRGGRRFRWYDLCRLCAATALRERAVKGSSNGRTRRLKTSDRIAPRRGGRPRLLDEPKLRALYAAYASAGLSIYDLVDQLLAAGHSGTRQGLYQSMLYGWRKLELPLRSKGEALALAHHRRGRTGRKPPAKCAALNGLGKRCGQWASKTNDYCYAHQEAADAA